MAIACSAEIATEVRKEISLATTTTTMADNDNGEEVVVEKDGEEEEILYDNGGSSDGSSSPQPSPSPSRSQSQEDLLSLMFNLDPPCLRRNAWSEPSAEKYYVRSKNYLTDNVKQLCEKSAFNLLSVDLVNSEKPMYSGICAHPEERVQKSLARERETGVREMPEFVFAINLCVPKSVETTTTDSPGTPSKMKNTMGKLTSSLTKSKTSSSSSLTSAYYHAVFYFGADKDCMDEIKEGKTPFGKIMKEFLWGKSDDYRDKTFKLIPRIVEGNYVVKKSVGSKPAILGSKIKQYYIRDDSSDRYFEVFVDIGSDSVAKRVTKLCFGYLKTIVVDMMFALEGQDESTLPERIFGGVRIKNVDFKKFRDGSRTVQNIN